MDKSSIKKFLHKFIGYENYLFIFAIYTVKRLRMNRHEKEFAYFLTMVPAEGAILDIGANIGSMTCALALQHPKAKVYSFEPMPSNINVWKRVVKYFKLKNARLFEMALGEQTGQLDMVLPVINNVQMHGMSHVVRENDDSDWNKGKFFSVPVKKLDDVNELKELPKITAIKIDVENFEYYVFRGAKELLKKHKPMIYCELWTNETRDVCLNYMRKEHGYEVKVFDGKKLVPFTNQDDTNFFLV